MALGSLVANLAASGFGSITAKFKKNKIEKKINSGIFEEEDLNWLASYYLNKKDYFQAETYANKLLEIAPDDALPKNLLFSIYFTKKDYEAAIQPLEQLIKEGQYLDANYHNLGYCYFLLGDIEKSDEYRLKAEELDPSLKNYKYKKL